jgi:hypothetical protein
VGDLWQSAWWIVQRSITGVKLNGLGYPTNVHIFIIRILQCTKFHELLINHAGEFAMTKCILNCLKSPKRHNGGKAQWTIKSFILQSSHIMILNSTKFGGNQTKDLEVGPDRQTDRQIPIYAHKLRLQGVYKSLVCKTPIVKVDRNKNVTLNRRPYGSYE